MRGGSHLVIGLKRLPQEADEFERWGYPDGFYMVIGALELAGVRDGSRWVFLGAIEGALRARALPSIVWLSPRKRGRTWTDDRSHLWSLFRW
jgi:hypothetical protein